MIYFKFKITNISDPEIINIKLGGITNNSFKVGVDDKFFVLRLPGKGNLINEKQKKQSSCGNRSRTNITFLIF